MLNRIVADTIGSYDGDGKLHLIQSLSRYDLKMKTISKSWQNESTSSIHLRKIVKVESAIRQIRFCFTAEKQCLK